MRNRTPALLSLALALAALLPSSPAPAQEAEITLKWASLAPKGTAWTKFLDQETDFIQKRTNGRMKNILYLGGVMGDEPDMIRKMKLGQIQIGAFTFSGVHTFFPFLGALELPFLVESPEEYDYVLDKAKPTLTRLLREKGYEPLFFSEQGQLNIISAGPIRAPEDLKKHKCWVWEDEPLQTAIYKALGVDHPVPAPVPEVLSGLETGLLDTVYAVSPMATVGLQWYTKIHYLVRNPIRWGGALILMDGKAFKKLPPWAVDAMKEALDKYGRGSIEDERHGQKLALEGMQQQGIQMIDWTPQEKAAFEKLTRPVWEQLARDGVYPKGLLDELVQAREAYRKLHPAPKP